MSSEDEKRAESGEPEPAAQAQPAPESGRNRWLTLAALVVVALLSVWRCG